MFIWINCRIHSFVKMQSFSNWIQCVVRSSAGRCPASPRLLMWTLPLGEMVTHVMDPFLRLIRSHAWGFTWSSIGRIFVDCRPNSRYWTFIQLWVSTKLVIYGHRTALIRVKLCEVREYPPSLNSSAGEVSDDVGVAHDHLVAVILLGGIGAPKVLPVLRQFSHCQEKICIWSKR